MAKPLATYTSDRDNNFNLLRFIAASLVLFTHSFALVTGYDDSQPLRLWLGMTWGAIAVDVFFVTSGFLIATSFFNRKSLFSFVWARILRIYPALIVAIIFCVFVVGLFFTTEKVSEYLTNIQTIKYFARNVTLITGVEHQLPGVFTNIPHRRLVNASLWTLPYEITMYTALAIAGIVLGYIRIKFTKNLLKPAIVSLALLGIFLTIINHFYPFAPVQIIRLFSMFFVGSAFYVCRDNIQLSHKLFVLTLATLLLSLLHRGVFFIVFSFALPYLLFYLAYIPKGKIRKFNNLGDYSYGIYIYAFPVQQSIIAIRPSTTIPEMIILSFIVTFILATLSWHFIEKKCLRMKNRFASSPTVYSSHS